MLGVGALEEYHADFSVIACIAKGSKHLGDGVRGESIPAVGAVNRYPSYPVRFFIDNIGEVAGFLPSNFRLHDTNLSDER